MINIAFWFDAPTEYSGGLNYLRNLLFALSLSKDKRIKAYIFFSTDVPDHILDAFRPYANVVRTKILKRFSIMWFLNKLMLKVFNSSLVINWILGIYKIDILSHFWEVFYGDHEFKLISWIPDFQYLHLPDFFQGIDVKTINSKNIRIAAKSELVILSSYDAKKDYQKLIPAIYGNKSRVLQFVSQPEYESSHANEGKSVAKKFGIGKKYFYLPNQFWQHKNHMVVFEAIKLLRDEGVQITLVCTGNLKDLRARDDEYINSIHKFIEEFDLHSNITILGLIDYKDVLELMRGSLAVLNPSNFEGWSSSVEEAKSMGKLVILSNIRVHREQDPKDAQYFQPNDISGLSTILKGVWLSKEANIDKIREKDAKADLRARTLIFANKYISIINEVYKS